MDETASRAMAEKGEAPNRAIDLHIVKNRDGERGKLSFDFMPAFSRFAEAAQDS